MADLTPALSQAPEGPQGRLTQQIALSRASPSDGGALGPQTGRPQSTFFYNGMKPGVFMVPRAAGSLLKKRGSVPPQNKKIARTAACRALLNKKNTKFNCIFYQTNSTYICTNYRCRGGYQVLRRDSNRDSVLQCTGILLRSGRSGSWLHLLQYGYVPQGLPDQVIEAARAPQLRAPIAESAIARGPGLKRRIARRDGRSPPRGVALASARRRIRPACAARASPVGSPTFRRRLRDEQRQ
jgi:hypothetical protein